MIRKITGKKGLSHVEVVVSFLIFISFVIFLFFFLNPTKSIQAKPKFSLVAEKLNDALSVPLKQITLKTQTASCFSIQLDFTPVISKNSVGQRVNALSSSGNILIQGGDTFYRLLSNPVFIENSFATPSCLLLSQSEYSLGLLIKNNVTAQSKLEEFKQSYDSDYNSMKDKLGIDKSFEFNAVVFKDSIEIMRAEQKKLVRIGITIKQLPIKIVNENGDINQGVLQIEIW